MNQHSMVPEFILENPLERINHSTAQSNSLGIDWDQVVVDLVVLRKQVKQLSDISKRTHIDMARLVVSLQEQE